MDIGHITFVLDVLGVNNEVADKEVHNAITDIGDLNETKNLQQTYCRE